MKKIVFAAMFCAVMSMGLAPAVQAADGSQQASPIVATKDKDAAESCAKQLAQADPKPTCVQCPKGYHCVHNPEGCEKD